VLAQLEERHDVESATVDRRGELLRIRTRAGGDVSGIHDELERMGFAAEAAANVDPNLRWYGRSSVGELSREEGQVIAARVVPAFGAAKGLPPALIDAVGASVETALYECFIGHQDAALVPGGLAASCRYAVSAATSALLGPDSAAALGLAIESDMSAGPGR
jgi:hypothetical protein